MNTRLDNRVGRLELGVLRNHAARRNTAAEGVERLMNDDAARDAVLAFQSYANGRHPDTDAGRAAFLADPRAEELYGEVLAHAKRLNAVWWADLDQLPHQQPRSNAATKSS